MEGLFYKNFLCEMGDKFLEGAVLDEGLMIRSCQGWGSFTNAFSSNLKTVYNLNFFDNHKGNQDKALTNLQNYGNIYT